MNGVSRRKSVYNLPEGCLVDGVGDADIGYCCTPSGNVIPPFMWKCVLGVHRWIVENRSGVLPPDGNCLSLGLSRSLAPKIRAFTTVWHPTLRFTPLNYINILKNVDIVPNCKAGGTSRALTEFVGFVFFFSSASNPNHFQPQTAPSRNRASVIFFSILFGTK